MRNVPRETFFPCFLPAVSLPRADRMGGRLAAGKGGAVGGRERGGRLAAAHRAAVDSSQGGG